MSKTMTVTHPQHGDAIVDLSVWNSKPPEGETSGGWDEATARANGWAPKGEVKADEPVKAGE